MTSEAFSEVYKFNYFYSKNNVLKGFGALWKLIWALVLDMRRKCRQTEMAMGILDAYKPMVLDMDRNWWREVIIYEIYVQSFQDSNNDGIGDLRGIIQRLGYLKELGADILRNKNQKPQNLLSNSIMTELLISPYCLAWQLMAVITHANTMTRLTGSSSASTAKHMAT